MEYIKLMPDYGCFPLWHHQSQEVGEINPESLGLSPDLCERLACWQNEYDQTLNASDPVISGFGSKEMEVKFVVKGYELALALKKELNGTQVVYFDVDQQRVRNV